MKHFKLLSLAAFISYFPASSQTGIINDSLINEICKSLDTNKNLPDTVRLQAIVIHHIYPAVNSLDKYKHDESFQFINLRLQRNCIEYKMISDRLFPPKGDWVHVDKKPVSMVDKKVCKEFLRVGKFSYFEANGDVVQVTLSNDYWEDNFKDGTYSKLKFNWIGDCEFEIEFIESNNSIRKNFSKKGDRYIYQILEKAPKHYKLSVEILGSSQFSTFNMYYLQ